MSLDGIFRRRRLPHWDVADATYFITACLAGSVPATGLKELFAYRAALDARHRPAGLAPADWELQMHKLVFKRLDDLLDGKPAIRHFDDQRLAQVVCEAMYHFAEVRYHLLAFVVMPSHLHWVIKPTRAYCESLAKAGSKRTPREQIMKSIKGFTARRCNRLLNRTGTFWQDESYDHCVRDEAELTRIIEYIEQNPVKAKLASTTYDWPFSSARERLLLGFAAGMPIVPPTSMRVSADD